jgi:hypothetical protein
VSCGSYFVGLSCVKNVSRSLHPGSLQPWLRLRRKMHAFGVLETRMGSDLGATFGTTGIRFPDSRSKGNLLSYAESRFIKKVHGDYVDFNMATRPNLVHAVNPKEFTMRMRLRWIGRNIPRADARWTGQLLSQPSRDQIRQEFQAAGYSAEEVEGFTNVVEERISELNRL